MRVCVCFALLCFAFLSTDGGGEREVTCVEFPVQASFGPRPSESFDSGHAIKPEVSLETVGAVTLTSEGCYRDRVKPCTLSKLLAWGLARHIVQSVVVFVNVSQHAGSVFL